MELQKEDSKMLQAFSVMAMVCLHLFDRDHTDLFQPLVFFKGIPLSFYVGQLADFCVFGFAFLSGYAHMIQSEQSGFYKRRLKGLLTLLSSFWMILIIFSVISVAVGQGSRMPHSLIEFLMNALLLSSSFNGAWWYLFAYAVLVFIAPLTMKWAKCVNPWIILIAGLFVYSIAYWVRFHIADSNWLLGKFGPLGMTFFEYLLGALCFRYRIFTRIYKRWIRVPQWVRGILAIFLVAGMLYARTLIVPSLFAAPVSGFILMTLFHFWRKPKCIQKFFLFIGTHATNIWLTHMFFYARRL